MDKVKQWIGLTVLVVLVIMAGGWFLLISPKNSEASDLTTQVAAKQVENSGLTTRLALLKGQAKGLPVQQAKLARVAAKIPDNPALPALIRALDKAAAETDVELVSLSPTTPAAYASVGAAVTPVVPAPAAAPAVATGSATPPALVPQVAAASPLQQIGVSLNVVGSYFQVEQFLDRLENLQRAFKVNGFTLAPGTNPLKVSPAAASTAQLGKTLTATITGQVFLVPAAVAAPITPVAPAAVPAK